VEVRKGAEEQYRPEVFVVPNAASDLGLVRAALTQRVATMQMDWPGLAFEEQAGRFHLLIPERFRVGHDEHLQWSRGASWTT
jgi:hypothetical protein